MKADKDIIILKVKVKKNFALQRPKHLIYLKIFNFSYIPKEQKETSLLDYHKDESDNQHASIIDNSAYSRFEKLFSTSCYLPQNQYFYFDALNPLVHFPALTHLKNSDEIVQLPKNIIKSNNSSEYNPLTKLVQRKGYHLNIMKRLFKFSNLWLGYLSVIIQNIFYMTCVLVIDCWDEMKIKK